MDNINHDIGYYLTKFIHNIDDLSNFCRLNKNFHKICYDNKNLIAKHLLTIYEVNYENPDDFIYKYYINRAKKQKKYKNINGTWNYTSIFKLYMKQFYTKSIRDRNNDLSSIPNYPNLEELDCGKNQLIYLPNYKNLKFLDCDSNNLQTLPNLLNLKVLNCNDNKLTSLPSLPNLEILNCEQNYLTSIPIYPKLKSCRADNNLCIDIDESDE